MILVTGSTGYLGSHLIINLLRSKRIIRALKRENSIIPDILRPYENLIEWVNGDVLDIMNLPVVFEGVSEVIHTAGLLNNSKAKVREILSVNIEGTANLINLALEFPVKKFIYISTTATLSFNPGTSLTQSRLKDFNQSKSSYVFGKIEAEKEVWRGLMEELPAVIINPSLILSKWGDINPNPHLLELYTQGSTYYTNNQFGFIWIEDLVNAIVAILDLEESKDQYIISSENISNANLVSRINKSLGLPEPGRAYNDKPNKLFFWKPYSKPAESTIAIDQLCRLEDGLKPISQSSLVPIPGAPFKKFLELF